MIPLSDVLFRQLQFDAGTVAGAREVFQSLVTDLIALRYPAANEVSGPGGGDWGIDTYVGRLDQSIVVWQSKFFLSWTGEDQRGQIRDSFKQVNEKARSEGFELAAWTLCVPCLLAPTEQKWWDGWAAKQRRTAGVKITLWNGVELRRQLMQPDADAVYRNYFGGGRTSLGSLQVQTPDDVSGFSDALFVRQLEEAGMAETDAARGLFFAAEALARDLASGGDRAGIAALKELHLEVHALWEGHYNTRVGAADPDGRIAKLVEEVLTAAAVCADPEELRLRPAHRKGIVHRLVEDARAGWVRDWRKIAESHKGRPAGEVANILLADMVDGGES
ncbi:hypothetical protein ACFXO9_08710 [Nocardia tengchongensis]|uniref:hypothetical protein n=1 Tax=Nocardia tengchongensis TaxID=2055889 RepID=UPI0036B7B58D